MYTLGQGLEMYMYAARARARKAVNNFKLLTSTIYI